MERLNSGLTSILLEGMEPSFCRASFKSLPPLIAGSLCTPSAATKMVTCRNSLHHNGKKNSHFYSVKNNYDYQTGDDFAFLKFRERHRYIIVIYIPTTDLVWPSKTEDNNLYHLRGLSMLFLANVHSKTQNSWVPFVY